MDGTGVVSTVSLHIHQDLGILLLDLEVGEKKEFLSANHWAWNSCFCDRWSSTMVRFIRRNSRDMFLFSLASLWISLASCSTLGFRRHMRTTKACLTPTLWQEMVPELLLPLPEFLVFFLFYAGRLLYSHNTCMRYSLLKSLSYI
ncbi:uncharacterized protein LOC130340156 isoform X3 [Hyla sarda]|uniref:uncharacterized protein LOC130290272 isoform X3 n=1 Tax=Hyla sarda TaxID=327740 RepID=UPI0024C451C5|nr:uncharacterized protein LOC130290272 isoform X3 [Hyla sarda]XP_056410106.1 uncharacterized protein LOC130340156 isoform X3 [Hyla sarda]